MKLFNNIGIVSSFICAVHCAITPLLLTFLPLWGLSLLADKTFEVIMLCLSGIFGILNLCFGIKKHKSYKALSLFSIGFGLSAIGNMFHSHIENHKHHEVFEPYILFLVCGGILICISYIVNSKLCNSCKVCHVR